MQELIDAITSIEVTVNGTVVAGSVLLALLCIALGVLFESGVLTLLGIGVLLLVFGPQVFEVAQFLLNSADAVMETG